jgi:DNA-binding response OmpR family regulator
VGESEQYRHFYLFDIGFGKTSAYLQGDLAADPCWRIVGRDGDLGLTALMDILYADDDQDIRDLVSFSFELDATARVQTVSSGDEALEALRARSYDAVLLDVMMPDLDGPGVLTRMKEGLAPETPVIFVTARALPEERRRYFAMGATDVITKPFDPLTLVAKVRSALKRPG